MTCKLYGAMLALFRFEAHGRSCGMLKGVEPNEWLVTQRDREAYMQQVQWYVAEMDRCQRAMRVQDERMAWMGGAIRRKDAELRENAALINRMMNVGGRMREEYARLQAEVAVLRARGVRAMEA
jgi:hypothetical protein